MSKQIFPCELAEIVAGLLIKPSLLGELDSPEKHQAFMEDIGRVIADHCGGVVNGVNYDDFGQDYLSDQFEAPTLSVSVDGSLPSLMGNVWSYFDTDAGWEDEDAGALGIDQGIAPTKLEISEMRARLQALIPGVALANNSPQSFQFEMVDWDVSDNVVSVSDGDLHPYQVKVNLGKQCGFEFVNTQGEPCFGFLIEVDKGAPVVRFGTGSSEPKLHVRLDLAKKDLAIDMPTPNA